MKINFDPVLLGRLAVAGSPFLIVILSPIVMGDEETNNLFSLIAWSAILCAMVSFGSNAALAKHLFTFGDANAGSLVAVIALGKLIALLIICLIGKLFNVFGDLRLDILIFTAFSGSLSFVDYVSEAYGKKYLEQFSLLKIVVFSFFFVVKLIVLGVNPNYIYFILYVEWVIVWIALYFGIITKRKGLILRSFSLVDVKEVCSFISSTSWVWFSAILQLGWTRGFFIILTRDIGAASANHYFLLLRVIEAFSFIPNSLSMKYFAKVIRAQEHQVKLIRLRYIESLKKVSIFVAFLSFISMYLVNTFVVGKSFHYSYYLIIGFSAILYIFRIGLSREIVLQKVFYLSLVSYLSAIIGAFLCYRGLGADSLLDALLSYFIFLTICFMSPFVISPKVFRDFTSSFFRVNKL